MKADEAAAPVVVLAQDARSRVESLELDGRTVVRKTYRSPPLLLWRTLLRGSRARREFRNLAALRAAGLPSVRTVGWDERRVLGCVVSSTLVTEHLAGALDLQSVLRAERAPRRRAELARRFGALLRALHDAGFCSTTASPRNFLVLPGSDDLVVIDQPLLTRPPRLLRRRAAQIDLYDAFFSPRRLQEWSRTERWRGVRAYGKGDRRSARATWSGVARRWRFTLRLDRDLARILGQLRPTKPPSPTP